MAKKLKLGEDLKNVIIDLIKIAITNDLKTTILNLLDNNNYSKNYNLVTGASPIKTGRKIDGKEEYVYRINLGSLPNNNTKTYNLPFTIGKCYRVEGVAHRSVDGVDFPLPYVNPGAGINFCIGIWTQQNKQLVVNAGTDRSNLTGYVDIFFSY